jgi:hypothetical protein
MPDMPSPAHSPALVIGGMHRSGTSLLASLCQGAGLALGQRLLAAGNGNPSGHYEDLDFVELHERILVANGLGSEGFTADATPVIPDRLRHEALALVAARRGLGTPWGWKDPRTVLLLDEWATLVPEARFLVVFRPPWEVADSLYRRGDPAFHHNPPLALAVWQHYNRRLSAFVVRHPDRCLVCELSQVVTSPGPVFDAIRRRLGVPLGEPPGDRFHDSLLRSADDDARAGLVRAVCPPAWDTYLELRRWAATTAPLPDTDAVSMEANRGPVEADRCAVLEWARSAAAERHQREAETRAATLERALADALRERDASLEAGQRLEGDLVAATTRAADLAADLAAAQATAAALRIRLASWQATATEIQAALAAIDHSRGDTDLAGRFARQWPDAPSASPAAA